MSNTASLINKFNQQINIERLKLHLSKYDLNDTITFHHRWTATIPISDIDSIVKMIETEYTLETSGESFLPDYFDVYYTVKNINGDIKDKFKLVNPIQTYDKTIPVFNMID